MKGISQRAKYGLRALQALAREHGKGPVLISELATREEIPRKFLELILLDLKRHGLLQSKRGKGGGYLLAKEPGEITLGQVLRIFDGPLAPLPCVSETAYRRCDECRDETICALRHVMKQVRDETAKILDGKTLADLLHDTERLLKEKRPGPMYYI